MTIKRLYMTMIRKKNIIKNEIDNKGVTLSYKEMEISDSPFDLFRKIYHTYDYAFLLESANSDTRLAEYSFIGYNPSKIFKAKGNLVQIQSRDTSRTLKEQVKDPLKKLREVVIRSSIEDYKFRFIGGAVGYVSYGAINYWEELGKLVSRATGFPDMEFGLFNDVIVFDHKHAKVYSLTKGSNSSDAMKDILIETIPLKSPNATPPHLSPNKKRFIEEVKTIKEQIASGDIFQAVISKRYDFKTRGDLLAFYKKLKEINPSPYMFYLKFGKRQIIGSSPEMLYRVDGKKVETFPIAGTRPFIIGSDKNIKFREELMADPKESAEHLMLVDLARNDIGKISRYGSVKVLSFMDVREFSHVQHIVSHVVGEIKNGADCFDVMRATFPAGTVTGAPKVRAIEIIDSLEESPRGPYAGAVGYFSFNGNSDFAIAIRTLFADGAKCYIQTGAGIVADSIPENEWNETEEKAGALLQALYGSFPKIKISREE